MVSKLSLFLIWPIPLPLSPLGGRWMSPPTEPKIRLFLVFEDLRSAWLLFVCLLRLFGIVFGTVYLSRLFDYCLSVLMLRLFGTICLTIETIWLPCVCWDYLVIVCLSACQFIRSLFVCLSRSFGHYLSAYQDHSVTIFLQLWMLQRLSLLILPSIATFTNYYCHCCGTSCKSRGKVKILKYDMRSTRYSFS